MNLRVANADDLTSVLDRILDKGIVLDCWVRVMPEQVEPLLADSAVSLVSSSVYVGYASIGAWQEHRGLDELFAFWQRDLWTK